MKCGFVWKEWSCHYQNLHWKLGQLTPCFRSLGIFCDYSQFFLKCFSSFAAVKMKSTLRIICFLFFQDRKLKLSASVWNRILWFNSYSSFIVIFSFSIDYLIELKFCEVSWNAFSNRCWKFQFSILKNKKVLFLKKYFLSRGQYQNKKALFTDSIFREGFG